MRFNWRLFNLQDLCCAKKREVPASVLRAVKLAAELIVNAVVSPSPGVSKIFDPRANKLS